jgi:hypothetical protein
MDRNTVIVMNWIYVPLLMSAAIILIWKMVSDKLKGRQLSSDLTTSALGLVVAVVGFLQLNVDSGSGVSLALLVVQLSLLVVLTKRLWSPVMQKLRG